MLVLNLLSNHLVPFSLYLFELIVLITVTSDLKVKYSNLEFKKIKKPSRLFISVIFSYNGGVCTVPHENSSYLCQMKALIAKLTGSKY